MRGLLQQCSAVAAIVAAVAVPSGFGDTGSPPPPSVSDVEAIEIPKATRHHFHTVVLPQYREWVTQIGTKDCLPIFSFYVAQAGYAPGNQFMFIHLYVTQR